MCGIVGLLQLKGRSWQEPPEDLKSMLSTISHRGPDSTGIFVEGPVCMGVNRLAIIDPGPQSDQPITSKDGQYTIAFNGEIYNYRELRHQLQQDGYQFYTGSDTEVLLALYILKGEKCLQKLRGMFAFAIWDNKNQSLFIARDRIGEKPLVYYKDDNIFAFASELPALLASTRVVRKINPAGLVSAMHFMHAIAPLSPFADIHKLAPAHHLTIFTEPDTRIAVKRYWQCNFTGFELFTDEKECTEEIIRCFDDTVSLMSRCDAKVGALLSGGLDSSSVVASMSRVLKNFQTFRISSEKSLGSKKEKSSAFEVSRRYNTQHHEYSLSQSNLAHLVDVVHHHGEPIATAVPIDAYLVSREMKKHVKVALCGAGGDELFGGYHDHQLLHILDTFAGFSTPKNSYKLQEEESKFAENVFRRIGANNPEKVFTHLKYHDLALREKIFSPEMLEIYNENLPHKTCENNYLTSGADNLINGFFNQQLNSISQYSMAEINDRMGMAHSVEIRSPFLDVEMVELAMKIPPRFKISPTLGDPTCKKILRKAMQHRLPENTLSIEKIGFGGTVPYEKWLQDDSSDFIDEKLASHALADCGLFDPGAIQELYTLYQCGAALDKDLFVGLASIAIWLEEFF